MPPKRRHNPDEQPDERPPDTAELREPETFDPVASLMRELGAAGGSARVIVRKIAPVAEQGYVGEWSADDFTLGALAEVSGPGKYAAQVRDARGQYLRQVTLDVSPRVRRVGGGGGAGAWTPAPSPPPAPAASPGPAVPAAPALADTLLVTLMQQQGEMLRALASRPAQPDAGLALLGSIVPAMMRDRSGPDTLLRAVEVVDRLRGDAEPDSPATPEAVEMRVFERIVERIAGMLERRGFTPANTPALEAARPVAAPAPTAPTPATPTVPAASADPAKPAPLPALVVLIAAAADDGRVRPNTIAQAVVDSIGAETARQYLTLPDGALAGEVVRLIPRLESRREYLSAVESAVRGLVREQPEECSNDDE